MDFGAIATLINSVVDRVFPDPAQAAQLKAQLQTALLDAQTKQDQSQSAVNQAEASSGNIFEAGWRPMIGWFCAGAVGYQYLLVPVSVWCAAWLGFNLPMPPTLDAGIWPLMTGLLGMSTLRTYEKVTGVTTKTPGH